MSTASGSSAKRPAVAPLTSHALAAYLPESRGGTLGHRKKNKTAGSSVAPPSDAVRSAARALALQNGQNASTFHRLESTRQLAQQKADALQLKPAPERLLQPRDFRDATDVVTEEDYVSGIAAIIERDFFPGLPKLRLQSELLNTPKHDEITRRKLIHEILALERREKDKEIYNVSDVTKIVQEAGGSGKYTTLSTRNLDLDEYLAKYMSEDNASFRVLLEKDFVKKRQKEAFVEKKEEFERLQLMLENSEKLAIEYAPQGKGVLGMGAQKTLDRLRQAYEEDHRKLAATERQNRPELWKKNAKKLKGNKEEQGQLGTSSSSAKNVNAGATSFDGAHENGEGHWLKSGAAAPYLAAEGLHEGNSKLFAEARLEADLARNSSGDNMLKLSMDDADLDPNSYKIQQQIAAFTAESRADRGAAAASDVPLGARRFFLNPSGRGATAGAAGVAALEGGNGNHALTNGPSTSAAAPAARAGGPLSSASSRNQIHQLNLKDELPGSAASDDVSDVDHLDSVSNVAVDHDAASSFGAASSLAGIESANPQANNGGHLQATAAIVSARNPDTLGLKTKPANTARNELFFNPRGIVPASHLNAQRRGQTALANTRFPVRKTYEKEARKQEEKREAKSLEAARIQEYGQMAVDGSFQQNDNADFVHTPNLDPDALIAQGLMSPLMTYGAVANTPLLLDASGNPVVGATSGIGGATATSADLDAVEARLRAAEGIDGDFDLPAGEGGSLTGGAGGALNTYYAVPASSASEAKRDKMDRDKRENKETMKERQLQRMRELGVNVEERAGKYGNTPMVGGGSTPAVSVVSSTGGPGSRHLSGAVSAAGESSSVAATRNRENLKRSARPAPSEAGVSVISSRRGGGGGSVAGSSAISLSEKAARALNRGELSKLPGHLTPGYSSIFNQARVAGKKAKVPGVTFGSSSSSRAIIPSGTTAPVAVSSSAMSSASSVRGGGEGSVRSGANNSSASSSRSKQQLGKFARNLGLGAPSLNVHPSLRTPSLQVDGKIDGKTEEEESKPPAAKKPKT
eukprot:g2815.t1